jgi:microcompartment protein CcmL/EutN
MVFTLADEVAGAVDAVDVVIDCAAAETANTTGMVVSKRIVFRDFVKVER